MSSTKYEEVDHTGDVGLRIFGDTFEELLTNAAEGMLSLIGRAEFAAGELVDRRIEIDFASPEDALYDWLRALLLDLELRGFFPRTIRLSSSPGHLSAILEGGRFDPARHEFFTEIKAVTRHGLRVSERPGGGFEAEVIFDV